MGEPDKKKENSKDYSRENDIINPEEFAKLEKQEGKRNILRSIVGKLKGKATKAPKKEAEQPEPAGEKAEHDKMLMQEITNLNSKFDDLVRKVERNAGKIELEGENKNALSNRLSEFVSQVGELRSIIVNKERYFNQVEAKVDKLFTQVESIKPTELEKRFNQINVKLGTSNADIEKINFNISNLQTSQQELKDKMASVKSFKNVADSLKEIKDIENNIEKTKSYTDNKSAKVEMLAEDLDNRLREFDRMHEEINSATSAIGEIQSKQDELDNRMQKLAKEEDVSELKKSIEILKNDVFKGYMEQFAPIAQKVQNRPDNTTLFRRLFSSKKGDSDTGNQDTEAGTDRGTAAAQESYGSYALDYEQESGRRTEAEEKTDEMIHSFIERSKTAGRSPQKISEMLSGAGYEDEVIRRALKDHGME